jgi:serine/threonine-protein kinase
VLADGSPKLIDFGASCLADRPLETWDRLLGTPSHMAPEQVLHGAANALTDVFSFAVLAYELITGEPPFGGDTVGSITYRVVYEPAPAPTTRVDGLPPVYDEIFARMLAKEPDRRLPSASAFVRALESGRDRRTVPPTPSYEVLDPHERDLARRREGAPRMGDASCVVEIRSEPEGARVWWNGVERGLTPLRICETSPGPHAVKLVLDGHTPVEAGFMVPEAPSLQLQFTMAAASAARVLEFKARRGGA